MSDAIVEHSHEMIRRGSKSFAAAAWLFDHETRGKAYMLYAWCRYCDDQIDGQEYGLGTAEVTTPERFARLQSLRANTSDAFAGKAMSDPVFAAFQRVAREASIPQCYPLELLTGFEMDVQGARYRDITDTLLYCYRVAGVVGIMMACVMGARGSKALARAADLGIAFQLTNIARDVMDDAAVGRCYLPENWLEQAGVSRGIQADPRARAAVFSVVQRLLHEADRYYGSATQGLQALPFRSAWAVATALGVYREIGEIVLARGAAAWDQRAVVSRPRKALQGILGLLAALKAISLDRWTATRPREDTLWIDPDSSVEE